MFSDEDICWPFTFDDHFISSPAEIVGRLSEIIDYLDKLPKTGSKSQDQKNKDFAKLFKFMHGLVVITMYHWDCERFRSIFLTQEEEKPKETE